MHFSGILANILHMQQIECLRSFRMLLSALFIKCLGFIRLIRMENRTLIRFQATPILAVPENARENE